MGLGRLFSTVLVAHFALLPTVRTVCDLACAPAPAAAPAAHCPSHERAPAPDAGNRGDTCEHEHDEHSRVVARATPGFDGLLEPLEWAALPAVSGTRPATGGVTARVLLPPLPPTRFSVPLRI